MEGVGLIVGILVLIVFYFTCSSIWGIEKQLERIADHLERGDFLAKIKPPPPPPV